MGNTATVVVRPHLLVNGRTAPLDLLKNAKITLTTNSFIDNIPQTKVFDRLDLEGGDITVDCQVPANLESIEIKMEAEV